MAGGPAIGHDRAMLARLLALSLLLALPNLAHAAEGPAAAQVSVCFVPGPESCGEMIAGALDEARSSIRLQAYMLTSPVILHALAAAKRRGVAVEAILDKSQDPEERAGARYGGATYLMNAGVPVTIDDAPAIAHNKVIIVDERLVITGSFNFTRAADTRNAENVVLIDGTDVARQFLANWRNRRAQSRLIRAE
jgi:phospholipase D